MNTCPITVRPGQILGHRKNGSPIFAIAGGSEPAGDPASPPAAVPAPPAAAAAPPAATVTETATQKVDDAFSGWDGKVETLPPAAQKIITDLRKENGDTRAAKNAETERVKAILAAAGIKTDEDDPVKALETTKATNETLSQENRNLRVEIALTKAAADNKADGDLLTAWLAHKGEIAKLDPTADGFAAALDALVKQTVKDNPKLLAGTQAATSSTVSGTGGPGVAADIDVRIAEAEKAGRFEESIALKRQKAYAPTA